MCCLSVFEFSVGIGGFVIELSQISFFFSLYQSGLHFIVCTLNSCSLVHVRRVSGHCIHIMVLIIF